MRDAQVQLALLKERINEFPEAALFQNSLERREKRSIKRVEKRMQRLGVRKLDRLMAAFRESMRCHLDSAEPERPLTRSLRAAVEAAFAKAVALRRRIDPKNPASIHRTRVAFKGFRYTAELLQPILPGITLRRLKQMRLYQARMGDIQDTEILLATLNEFARKNKKLAPSLLPLRCAIDQDRLELVARYIRIADELFGFWSPQTNVWRASNASGHFKGADEGSPHIKASPPRLDTLSLVQCPMSLASLSNPEDRIRPRVGERIKDGPSELVWRASRQRGGGENTETEP